MPPLVEYQKVVEEGEMAFHMDYAKGAHSHFQLLLLLSIHRQSILLESINWNVRCQ